MAYWLVLMVNTLLQSYYEEQKREQMQGPVLKRLEEEQQQQALAPSMVSADGDQQHTFQHDAGRPPPVQQPGLPFEQPSSPFEQPELLFDEVTSSQADEQQQPSLQLNAPRSWAGSRQLQQAHVCSQPETNGSMMHSAAAGMSGHNCGERVVTAHASPKPPLPSRSRRQISSEMSYLGGSAGNSAAGSGSDSDHV